MLALGGIGIWVGATLLLSQLRWFARPSLAERLRLYAPGGLATKRHSGLLSLESFHDVIAPLSQAIGERLARIFGVSEELGARLERIHAAYDVTTFRVRQLGWSLLAVTGGSFVALALRPPALVAALFVLGGPLLAFLLLEQQVSNASAAWQRRVFLELPVVSEQLAMLLSAGYSLGGAMNRVATRGEGAVSKDLGRVIGRMRQGLSESEALREWAAVANVPALDRLVPVLALNRETSDLGRLISDEARAIRKDAQRELVETMERRSQQVWIPVTVATLIPGVIFLAIPFIEALKLFGG